ncbi:MAG TPA: hypothetical protein VGN21_09525 [Stellaceae bacterium]
MASAILYTDSGGLASPSNPITITTAAGALFDGDTSIVLNSPYGRPLQWSTMVPTLSL